MRGKKRCTQKRYKTTSANANLALSWYFCFPLKSGSCKHLVFWLKPCWRFQLSSNLLCLQLNSMHALPLPFDNTWHTSPAGARNRIKYGKCIVLLTSTREAGSQGSVMATCINQKVMPHCMTPAISQSTWGVNVLSLRLIKSILFSSVLQWGAAAFCDYVLALDIWYANNSMMPVHTRLSQEMTSRWLRRRHPSLKCRQCDAFHWH